MTGLIDSHAHLSFEGLYDQVDDVLNRAKEAGVDKVLTIGTDLQHALRTVGLARQYAGQVFAAAAFHPHEAGSVSEEDIRAMAELWTDPSIVATGEMGLDYHYDFADREVQRSVFSAQLALAKPLGKPLIVHCREALGDVIAILIDQGFAYQPVVFHCFTGTGEEAARIAEHGWRISFTGIVTFKKSTWLAEIAQRYPADELMIETDSPYLSPVPVRGKHPNEPAHVAHTARFLAELRGITYEAFVEQTHRNTEQFFGM